MIIVMNRETLLNSFLKDIITLICLCILGYFNYKYLGNSEVIYAASLVVSYAVMKQIIRKKDWDVYNVTIAEYETVINKLLEIRNDNNS